MTATRVLIVDDVPQVRQDLHTILTLVGGIEVVGEAADGWQAISQIDTLRPDVILMDLEMPGLDGYEATRHIKCRHPACRIVALTVHDYAAAHHRANHAGVDAFIVKGAPVETLVRAIKGRSAQ